MFYDSYSTNKEINKVFAAEIQCNQ